MTFGEFWVTPAVTNQIVSTRYMIQVKQTPLIWLCNILIYVICLFCPRFCHYNNPKPVVYITALLKSSFCTASAQSDQNHWLPIEHRLSSDRSSQGAQCHVILFVLTCSSSVDNLLCEDIDVLKIFIPKNWSYMFRCGKELNSAHRLCMLSQLCIHFVTLTQVSSWNKLDWARRLWKNDVMGWICSNSDEPPYDKTNKVTVCPAKTQISLGICLVCSESSLCVQWVAKDSSFLHADSEDSNQTERMPRLIWAFAGRTAISLVLSCRSSGMHIFMTKLFQKHHWDMGEKWLASDDHDLIFKVTPTLWMSNFDQKSLFAPCLWNQMMDSGQSLCIIVSVG